MKIIFTFLLSYNLFASEGLTKLGERLFNDIRFSEAFYTASKADPNLFTQETIKDANACIRCHKIDEQFDVTNGLGMRTYSDFTKLSVVPFNPKDFVKQTNRNTPPLVGIGSKWNNNRFSHWDAEFFDHSETVLGNFTGRNMGWHTSQQDDAFFNIINIIKNDNGQDVLSQEFGGSYSNILLAVDPALPDELRLAEDERIDVFQVDDQSIIDLVVKAVTAYMDDLNFATDEDDHFTASPYDQFLKINNLPMKPYEGESTFNYSMRLRSAIINLKDPKYIEPKYFSTHGKYFAFDEKAFNGMKTFFSANENGVSRGQCIQCHNAPLFTDNLFHNVGTSQIDYDRVHGEGKFNQLKVPTFEQRNNGVLKNLTADINDPQRYDLGVWNFFGKLDKPELTNYIKELMCGSVDNCEVKDLHIRTLATFKTPGLRNLNHSAPYFHNGMAKTLSESISLYQEASILRKKNLLRNGDPRLRMMNLNQNDIDEIESFLNSLNEDYE